MVKTVEKTRVESVVKSRVKSRVKSSVKKRRGVEKNVGVSIEK